MDGYPCWLVVVNRRGADQIGILRGQGGLNRGAAHGSIKAIAAHKGGWLIDAIVAYHRALDKVRPKDRQGELLHRGFDRLGCNVIN